MEKIPYWLQATLITGLCGWLLWREIRTPARAPKEKKLLRIIRNLIVATGSAVLVQYVEIPVIRPLAALMETHNFGLVNLLGLPEWLKILTTVLALDYTLYLWHWCNHRISFLWRFHQPHHTDRDMDISTAVRFHFGEIFLSVGWRAIQVVSIGVSPIAYSVWQTSILLCILFHHSNVRLHRKVEYLLGSVLVTPRMHEIHHSNVHTESDSNWSSGLSLWDRLHGTLREDIPSQEITIGIPAYSSMREVVLAKIFGMPFVKQKESWRLPDGQILEDRSLKFSGTAH